MKSVPIITALMNTVNLINEQTHYAKVWETINL